MSEQRAMRITAALALVAIVVLVLFTCARDANAAGRRALTREQASLYAFGAAIDITWTGPLAAESTDESVCCARRVSPNRWRFVSHITANEHHYIALIDVTRRAPENRPTATWAWLAGHGPQAVQP